MNGIWIIRTVADGLYNIKFGNLFSGAELDCGETTDTDEILTHCVETGSGTFEPVFFDGEMVGWIHPRLDEEYVNVLPCNLDSSLQMKA